MKKPSKKTTVGVKSVWFDESRAFAVHDPKWSPTHGLTLAVRVTDAHRMDPPLPDNVPKADRFPMYRAEVGYAFCCRAEDKFGEKNGWTGAVKRLKTKPLIVYCRIGDPILPAFTETLREEVKAGRTRPGKGMGLPDLVRMWLKDPSKVSVKKAETPVLKKYVLMIPLGKVPQTLSECGFDLLKVRAKSEADARMKAPMGTNPVVVEAEFIPVLIAKLARMIAPPGSNL